MSRKSLPAIIRSYLVPFTEAVAQMCSIRKGVLEISENSQKNICARVSFLIKLQAEGCNFI